MRVLITGGNRGLGVTVSKSISEKWLFHQK